MIDFVNTCIVYIEEYVIYLFATGIVCKNDRTIGWHDLCECIVCRHSTKDKQLKLK